MVVLWVCPTAFTTSMFVFGTVNECVEEPTLAIVREGPLATVMVMGVKTNALPAPCCRVSAATEGAGDGEPPPPYRPYPPPLELFEGEGVGEPAWAPVVLFAHAVPRSAATI